jgi:hypothetical protein
MSKNPSTKTSTNQAYTSTYDWKSAPVNAQMQGVIDLANKPVSVDPSTQQRYGEMEEQVDRSIDDPFGPATSPDVRAKARLSRVLTIRRDRDKAMREGYADAENTSFARKSAAAALTMPQLVQSGGTNTGTQNTTQNPGWMSYVTQGIGAAAGIA